MLLPHLSHQKENREMQLTEQHVIDHDDPRYAVIDAAAFQSKNLYNAALYVVRQSFIFEGKYLNYNQMDKLMKLHEAYKALPSKVAQQVLRGLHVNWVSFFEGLEAYEAGVSKDYKASFNQKGYQSRSKPNRKIFVKSALFLVIVITLSKSFTAKNLSRRTSILLSALPLILESPI
jgi:transposase